MKSENAKQVDAYLTDELDENKSLIKSELNIPYNGKCSNVAVRVKDILYASTRLQTVIKTDEGFEVDVTHQGKLAGKKYQLNELRSGKLLQHGNISVKAAVSNEKESDNIFEMKKTGTK